MYIYICMYIYIYIYFFFFFSGLSYLQDVSRTNSSRMISPILSARLCSSCYTFSFFETTGTEITFTFLCVYQVLTKENQLNSKLFDWRNQW